MRMLDLSAPAKVNLGLRITGLRDDGYHLIDSWFVPLDLADRVQLRLHEAVATDVVLALSGDRVDGTPATDDNLAVRAARRFLERVHPAARVEIRLEKRIPAGAGLGGGSSDAGAVLRGLHDWFPDALAPGELFELALGLGADVPFFLDPRPCRVRGIGEQIEPLAGLPALPLLVLSPGISLATADVYAAWDAREGSLTQNPVRPTMPSGFNTGFDAGTLERLLENDLESPAVRLCPPIASLQEQLRSLGALAVGMSGSGSAVFGVFSDLPAAESALATGRFDTVGVAGIEVWARVVKTAASVAAEPA